MVPFSGCPMWRILVVSIALLPLMGCGSKRNQGGVLSGKITYKGQPVNGASLHLISPSSADTNITIPVSQEGTFQSSNIPPGEYKIVVDAPPPPQQAMRMPPTKGMDPAKAEEMRQKLQQVQGDQKPTIAFPNKYKRVDQTDLKCNIKEGDQKLDLELKD